MTFCKCLSLVKSLWSGWQWWFQNINTVNTKSARDFSWYNVLESIATRKCFVSYMISCPKLQLKKSLVGIDISTDRLAWVHWNSRKISHPCKWMQNWTGKFSITVHLNANFSISSWIKLHLNGLQYSNATV